MTSRKSKKTAPAGLPTGAVAAEPQEGADAGASDDLRRAHLEKVVRSYRGQAIRAFRQAQRMQHQNLDQARAKAGEALDRATHAFWWAEDSDLEGPQHELMHKIGRWKRKQLGCSLAYENGTYGHTCPVGIAHKKMGMSIGFTGVRICSICRNDLSLDLCTHFRDRSYWVRGGADESGPCRVCRRASCRHRPDKLYRAFVVAIVKDLNVHEVSLVRKPADPGARLLFRPIDTEALANFLGPDFLVGTPVSCDQCLNGCVGFTEFGIEDGDGSE